MWINVIFSRANHTIFKIGNYFKAFLSFEFSKNFVYLFLNHNRLFVPCKLLKLFVVNILLFVYVFLICFSIVWLYFSISVFAASIGCLLLVMSSWWATVVLFNMRAIISYFASMFACQKDDSRSDGFVAMHRMYCIGEGHRWDAVKVSKSIGIVLMVFWSRDFLLKTTIFLFKFYNAISSFRQNKTKQSTNWLFCFKTK